MNLITNTWRELIRRRLWPVALLLVAALVAVPIKLAKTPAAAAPVPTATLAKAASAEANAKPVVELATASTEPKGHTRRRVLGRVKDPFEPAPLPKAKKKKKKQQTTAKAAATPAATPAASAGGGASATPTTPTPAAPAVPMTTFAKYTLKVRFGKADTTTDLPTLMLARLEPLPSTETPVLVYEGAENGGKYALFSIPGQVTAVGDGTCTPHPENCETLKLRAGETEFVTVTGTGSDETDGQYQLDLVKVYDKKTRVPTSSITSPAGGSQ